MKYKWESCDGGSTIGEDGPEGGVILKDEEIVGGARITLEKGGWVPFSITCGIYGTMVHTVFASEEAEAVKKYEGMKAEIEEFLNTPELDIEWCEGFVDRW